MIRKINTKITADETTGFGTNSSMYGGRLLQKDGSANIHKRGIDFFQKFSWYHTLIGMPAGKFMILLIASFLAVNLVFAMVYLMIGVEHLAGMAAKTGFQKFIEAYFFSTQTFTTVGYGRISPTGYLTSMIAAMEAFCGLLFFAIATGLFYGRFSRPRAFLKFSHNAIISPFRDGIALMFRMVPFKNNYLTNAEVKVTLGMIVDENGTKSNLFYQLPLQISKVNALTLNWTVVHPIDSHSPMYGLSLDDLKNYKAELLVFVSAFDDAFSNTVVSRTSYTAPEILWGRKFKPMYHKSMNGEHTIVEIDKLNATDEADISFAFVNLENSKEAAAIPRI